MREIARDSLTIIGLVESAHVILLAHTSLFAHVSRVINVMEVDSKADGTNGRVSDLNLRQPIEGMINQKNQRTANGHKSILKHIKYLRRQ